LFFETAACRVEMLVSHLVDQIKFCIFGSIV